MRSSPPRRAASSKAYSAAARAPADPSTPTTTTSRCPVSPRTPSAPLTVITRSLVCSVLRFPGRSSARRGAGTTGRRSPPGPQWSPGAGRCGRSGRARLGAGRTLGARLPNRPEATTAQGPPVEHPVVVRMREHRATNRQLRVADLITKFAGSMWFVYLHVAAFAVWMVGFEPSPWPTLTLVVSLEAIFLSTFVMIGQNRAAAFQQAKADHDFLEQETELKTNTQLTREIHALTEELHRRLVAEPDRARARERGVGPAAVDGPGAAPG